MGKGKKRKKKGKKQASSSEEESPKLDFKVEKFRKLSDLEEKLRHGSVVNLDSSGDEGEAQPQRQKFAIQPQLQEAAHPSGRWEDDDNDAPFLRDRPATAPTQGAAASVQNGPPAASEEDTGMADRGLAGTARPKKRKKGKESPAEAAAEATAGAPPTSPSGRERSPKKVKGPSRNQSRTSKFFDAGSSTPSSAESALKALARKAAVDGGDLSTPPPEGSAARPSIMETCMQELASPSCSPARDLEAGNGGASHSHETPTPSRPPLTQEPLPHPQDFREKLAATMEANSAEKKTRKLKAECKPEGEAEAGVPEEPQADSSHQNGTTKPSKKAGTKARKDRAATNARKEGQGGAAAGEMAEPGIDVDLDDVDMDPYDAGGSYHNPRIALWTPPPSNHSLIEEMLYDDPWRLLVACILLNKTSGKTVRRILWRLFELAPTPEAAVTADPQEVEAIIRPLGLFRKRTAMFKHFSKCYMDMNWSDPQELPGIGEYASDAYRMFCRGEWRKMRPPRDKDLLKYYTFLKETDGQGQGFEREVFQMPTSNSLSKDPHCWIGALCPPGGDVHDISSPLVPNAKNDDDIVLDVD